MCERNSNVATVETTTASWPPTADTLTRRQRDVLDLIVQGRSNKEIARILKLGPGTVKVHVAALFGKLGIHHRAAAAVAGARLIAEAIKRSESTEYIAPSSARILRFPGLGYTSRLSPRAR